VRLLTEQLAEASVKLDEANYKLGFLEANLVHQNARLLELEQRDQSRRASQFSFRTWLKNVLFSG
jgi:hypothetical protein